MPKSIFEVLNGYYYNSGQREQSYKSKRPDLTAQERFKRLNIKPGLDTVQRMIVYSFLIRLSEAKDIDITDYTLF